MNVYHASVALLLCCTALTAHGNDSTYLAGDIFINCGSTGKFVTINDREWLGDGGPELSSFLQINGSSTISTVIHKKLISADELLYTTARISQFRFSYAFHVNPGQKMIRFHFSPTLYRGFKGFRDLFTVEAGAFTLLGNFSASLMAKALGVNYFVKEFCLYLQEDEQLNIIFTPASGSSSSSLNTYAFINGVEIISVPPDVAYFHGRDIGVQLVGQKSQVYVDYSTALERIHRLVIKQNSVRDDGIFPVHLAREGSMVKNSTWKIPVDVGFRYLIRLHLSKLGHKIAESGNAVFSVSINEMIADTNIGMAKEGDGNNIPWYMDYMVMMRGQKDDIKHDIVIFVQSDYELHGLLATIEILKLSNSYNSLASPNPLSEAPDTSHKTIQTLLQILGYRNTMPTIGVIIISLVSIILHILQKISDVSTSKEEDKPSIRAQRLCRHFSWAELEVATENFSEALLLGKGGFGKVYRGVIDNGQTIIAVKRLKQGSCQGAREFLMEIETLSELRHFNLVSLIGYCRARGEMILVYDYMAWGTLADHIYKLPRDSDNFFYLTWKQRLTICIGAARGIDYLHTGHGLIHRDVKASNILLDENLVAKVSDFGLAKHEDKSKLESHVSTNVKGTPGHLDPDYVFTHKLTRKSDTYSFGVVLLETLCGRPILDYTLEDNKVNLIKWARKIISEGNVNQIVASDMRDEISKRSLEAFVAVAEKCIADEPKKRPTMGQLVLQLESVLELQDAHHVFELNEKGSSSGANTGQQILKLNETVSSSVASMEQQKMAIADSECFIKQFYIPHHIFDPEMGHDPLPYVPKCPVLVFINPKSGGQLGRDLLAMYQSLLHEKQVVNLVEEAPDDILRSLFVNLERLKNYNYELAAEIEEKLKLIVAGGDGTVGWLAGVVSDLKLSQPPPIAVVPLGTENNLPFAFGWGMKNPGIDRNSVLSFLDQVKKAKIMKIDSWHILMRMRAPKEGACDPIAPLELPHSLHAFHRVSSMDDLNVGGYQTFRGGFWNYFSMGMDAQVSYAFHVERKLHPEMFSSQLVNQSTYAKLRRSQGWFFAPLVHPSSRNIARLCKVQIMKMHGDWNDLHIPVSIRSIVCLNVPSYSGGLKFWGTPNRNKSSERGLTPPFVDDGLLEIIGFSNAWQKLSIAAKGTRLAQAHRIRFQFHKGAADHTYMMIDGEPWKQPLPCDDETVVVEISHLGQVKMLAVHGCRSESVYESYNWSAHYDSIDESDSDENESVGEEWRKFGAAETFKLPDDIDISHLS